MYLTPGGVRRTGSGPSVRGEDWLARLTGSHRQLFDAPAPAGGIPLVHVLNYYDTYNKAFNVPDKDVNGVLTFYGSTTFYGLNDAVWAKYRLGAFLDTQDSKGAWGPGNPWLPVGTSGPMADSRWGTNSASVIGRRLTPTTRNMGGNCRSSQSRNRAGTSLRRVRRSPRKTGDSRITQIGEVNSSAKTWASGIMVIAQNHSDWPVK